MSIITVTEGPSLPQRFVYTLGQTLVKNADASPAYNLHGLLYLSGDWLILSVPNALVRGVFSAMNEPGVEMPAGPTNDGRLDAHIVVMNPDEIDRLGGSDRIVERGKQFPYTLGRLVETDASDWPEVSKVWALRVHSPALQFLRRSYGLSSLPMDGAGDFRVVVAIRRSGVLGRNETSVKREG